MKKYGDVIRLSLMLAWMAFIFSRSMQPAAQSSMESQWVLELLDRLTPFELPESLIRKAAHFVEFGILGLLAEIFWAGKERPGREGRMLPPLLMCVLTAMCDETIQLFVEGRAGMVQDVWIDTAGAAAGILAALSWARRRRPPASRLHN